MPNKGLSSILEALQLGDCTSSITVIHPADIVGDVVKGLRERERNKREAAIAAAVGAAGEAAAAGRAGLIPEPPRPDEELLFSLHTTVNTSLLEQRLTGLDTHVSEHDASLSSQGCRIEHISELLQQLKVDSDKRAKANNALWRALITGPTSQGKPSSKPSTPVIRRPPSRPDSRSSDASEDAPSAARGPQPLPSVSTLWPTLQKHFATAASIEEHARTHIDPLVARLGAIDGPGGAIGGLSAGCESATNLARALEKRVQQLEQSAKAAPTAAASELNKQLTALQAKVGAMEAQHESAVRAITRQQEQLEQQQLELRSVKVEVGNFPRAQENRNMILADFFKLEQEPLLQAGNAATAQGKEVAVNTRDPEMDRNRDNEQDQGRKHVNAMFVSSVTRIVKDLVQPAVLREHAEKSKGVAELLLTDARSPEAAAEPTGELSMEGLLLRILALEESLRCVHPLTADDGDGAERPLGVSRQSASQSVTSTGVPAMGPQAARPSPEPAPMIGAELREFVKRMVSDHVTAIKAGLTPAATRQSDKLYIGLTEAEVTKMLEGGLGGLASTLRGESNEALTSLRERQGQLGTQAQSTQESLLALKGDVAGLAGELDQLRRSFFELQASIDQRPTNINQEISTPQPEERKRPATPLQQKQGDLSDAFTRQGIVIDELHRLNQQQQSKIKDQEISIEALRRSIGQLENERLTLRSSLADVRGEVQELKRQLEELRGTQRRNQIELQQRLTVQQQLLPSPLPPAPTAPLPGAPISTSGSNDSTPRKRSPKAKNSGVQSRYMHGVRGQSQRATTSPRAAGSRPTRSPPKSAALAPINNRPNTAPHPTITIPYHTNQSPPGGSIGIVSPPLGQGGDCINSTYTPQSRPQASSRFMTAGTVALPLALPRSTIISEPESAVLSRMEPSITVEGTPHVHRTINLTGGGGPYSYSVTTTAMVRGGASAAVLPGSAGGGSCPHLSLAEMVFHTSEETYQQVK